MKAMQLGTMALLALGLAGWEGGCGPRHLVPPTETTSTSGTTTGGTTGGTTGQGGTTGTTGSHGTTGSAGDCSGLDESDCTARRDCRAVYQPVPCGVDGFAYCESATPVVCPQYECAYADDSDPSWVCTTSYDENGCPGCPVCRPAEKGCTVDSDCGTNQYCDLPGGTSGAGCGAPAPDMRGVCVDRVLPCEADSDCPAGTACVTPYVDCPPNAFCAPPQPTCQPIVICAQVLCAPVDPTWICEPSTDDSGCPTCGNCHPPVATCSTDADCSSTEHCLPDPTDPCNGPEYDCFVAGRQTCQPILCQSDSDCSDGEACVPVAPIACPDGADCMVSAWVCENVSPPQRCFTDADCSQAGQTCQDDLVNCNGRDCPDPSRSCRPAPGCQSNADCQAGEVCARSDRACDATGPCPVDAAVCMPAPSHNCGDTDCSYDQVCVHSVGGAPTPDGQGLNVWACVALPEICERVDESGCNCAATVCGQGGTAVCGSPIQVTCNLP